MNVHDVEYHVPQRVLEDSYAFLALRGKQGYEGTGLWLGRPASNLVEITRFFAPEQDAMKGPHGVSVALTQRAHYALTDELRPGERFYVRIHSHPGRAYHSPTDDANAVLTHEGAISIVVPNFASAPIDLARCAIYRLEHGAGWLPLKPVAVALVFKVVA
jgi:hypothetical protein